MKNFDFNYHSEYVFTHTCVSFENSHSESSLIHFLECSESVLNYQLYKPVNSNSYHLKMITFDHVSVIVWLVRNNYL